MRLFWVHVANWDWIRSVKLAVGIPLVSNGNIRECPVLCTHFAPNAKCVYFECMYMAFYVGLDVYGSLCLCGCGTRGNISCVVLRKPSCLGSGLGQQLVTWMSHSHTKKNLITRKKDPFTHNKDRIPHTRHPFTHQRNPLKHKRARISHKRDPLTHSGDWIPKLSGDRIPKLMHLIPKLDWVLWHPEHKPHSFAFYPLCHPTLCVFFFLAFFLSRFLWPPNSRLCVCAVSF